MKPIHLSAALSLFMPFTHAVGAEAPSHCDAKETTYFNCTAGGNVVSLCGRDDKSGKYLQYRFGQPGQKLERVPTRTDDVDMGRTFYFTGIHNDEHWFDKTDVWFRNSDTSFSIEFIEQLDPEGRVTATESAVLFWKGLPEGAPGVVKCDQPDGGQNLGAAGRAIENIARPDHRWSVSPLECAWVAECQVK